MPCTVSIIFLIEIDSSVSFFMIKKYDSSVKKYKKVIPTVKK